MRYRTSHGRDGTLGKTGKKWILGKGEHTFRAVATPGMEDIVAAELRGLGATVSAQDPGGVLFQSTLLAAMEINLHAATTERVWAHAAEFRAKTFGELFHKTKRLDWSRVLPADCPLQITAASHRSRLVHTGRIQETVADALGRPLVPAAPNHQHLLARFVEDRCTLRVDLSGERLHQRGYREEGAMAPIRETRAAALLRWAGWTPGQPVCDPCCGSGTFLIEAARAAAGVAPGAARSFAFERWPRYDVAGFRRARTLAQAQPANPTTITGIDASPLAVDAARRNMERAQVEFSLQPGRFQDVALPPEAGLLIANPPYGKRVRTDLGGTWEDLGALFARACSWRRVLLSPDRRLYAAFRRGLQGPDPAKTLTFLHGGLKIRAMLWDSAPPS